MAYGYAGNILRIDLTDERISKTPTSEYARAFLGGRGINARLMFEESKAGVSAFDPDNPVIIGAGPLVGTGIIGGARHEITTRSPQQVPEGFGNAQGGGSFGPEMKYAGYDHIVIKGRAEKPTYLYIENDDIFFKDASGLWGKGVFETEKLIREEVGDPEVAILSIGQAGENLVRVATIEHEYKAGAGLGAAWGAKNLKAVVIRGTKGIKVYDAEKILQVNEQMLESVKQWLKKNVERCQKNGKPYLPYPQWVVGQDALSEYTEETDMALVGYLKGFEWPDIEKTRAVPYLMKRMVRQLGCCPRSCQGILRVPGVGIGGMKCDPFWWPWQLYLTDMDKAFEATRLCEDYGLDNQNIATPVSWLMRLYEEGIITAKDTDGVAMEWGSGDALIHVIHSVANRKGFGDILADGVLSLAKKLGPEAEDLVMHRRGFVTNTMEIRIQAGVVLGTAVDTTAGRENWYSEVIWDRPLRETGQEKELEEAYARARETYGTEKAIIPWEYEKKAQGVISNEYEKYISDIFGICLFTLMYGGRPESQAHEIGAPRKVVYPLELDIYKATTGGDWNENDLITFAERALTLEKAYNVREGFAREDETLEEVIFKEPIPDGPHKGKMLDRARFEKMKDEYYVLRGWDVETSWPTKETYKRLGLGDVAASLQKLGKLPSKTKSKV
jgi:aldehyde:ferredoxin oxidoreductase